MGSHVTPAEYVSTGVDTLLHDSVGSTGLPCPRRYHPGLCHCCLASPPKSDSEPLKPPLLRCGQCQLVVYCSKKCQKKDWPKHKDLCRCNKILCGKNVFGRAKRAVASGQSWNNFRQNVSLAACVNMKRPLLPYERAIFWFPRVCEVCKSADQPSLACCPRCYSVFYCSSEHMEQDAFRHSKHCTSYLLMVECDLLEIKFGIQDLPIPVQVDEVYKNLPDKLMTMLRSQLEVNSTTALDPKSVTMLTERLSYPLSLLYAIQNIGIGLDNTPLHDIKELLVHVVGAMSLTELLGIIRWEYLVHRLPTLMRFHIVFIGPELYSDTDVMGDDIPDEHMLDDSGMTMCDDCSKRDRRIVYEMFNKCYHDFVSSSHYSVPDVIVAYNCGLHEQSVNSVGSWKQTLPLLVQNKRTPFVFTSYTAEEARLDLEILQQAATVKVLMEPRLNPFHSLRPYRDHEVSNDEPILYWNQYITCVRANEP